MLAGMPDEERTIQIVAARRAGLPARRAPGVRVDLRRAQRPLHPPHRLVDLLAERVSGGRRRALAILSVGTVLVCAFLLVSEGIETVLFTRMLGLLSNNIPEIDLWIIQSFVPVGGALLALVAVVQLACHFVGIAPRDMGEHPKDSIE